MQSIQERNHGDQLSRVTFFVPGTKGAKTKHRIPRKSSANPDNLRNFQVFESLFSSHFLFEKKLSARWGEIRSHSIQSAGVVHTHFDMKGSTVLKVTIPGPGVSFGHKFHVNIGKMLDKAEEQRRDTAFVLHMLQPLVDRMELDCTGFHVQHCIEAYVALMRAHGASANVEAANMWARKLWKLGCVCFVAFRRYKGCRTIVLQCADLMSKAAQVQLLGGDYAHAKDTVVLGEQFCASVVWEKRDNHTSDRKLYLGVVRDLATSYINVCIKLDERAAVIERLEAVFGGDTVLAVSNQGIFRLLRHLAEAYIGMDQWDDAYRILNKARTARAADVQQDRETVLIACEMVAALWKFKQNERAYEMFVDLADEASTRADLLEIVRDEEICARMMEDCMLIDAARREREWHDPEDTRAWRLCSSKRCDKVARGMPICAGCCRATYCNQECAANDWFWHRFECDMCHACERPLKALPIPKCRRCEWAKYCTRRCQIAHWPIHKGFCAAMKAKSYRP